MGEHHHAQVIPRAVLLGAGALLLVSLALAGAARHLRSAEPADEVAGPALETLMVRFEDRPDGAIAVLDGTTGREVALVPPRSNGFIRGVLRGMFRTRKQETVSREGLFRLSRQANGRLALDDPQTGRHVDLDAFGATNSAAFAQLLAAGAADGAGAPRPGAPAP